MVFYQFNHHLLNALVGGRNDPGIPRLQDDIVDFLDLGGGSFQSKLCGVGIDMVHRPFLYVQVRSVVVKVEVIFGCGLYFGDGFGMFVFHEQACVPGAALGCGTIYGDQQRQGSAHGFDAVLEASFQPDAVTIESQEFFDIGHLGKV